MLSLFLINCRNALAGMNPEYSGSFPHNEIIILGPHNSDKPNCDIFKQNLKFPHTFLYLADDTCRLLNAWLDKKYSGDDHTKTFAYDECYTTRDTEKNVLDPLTVTTTSSGMFTYQGLQFKVRFILQ